MTFIYAKSNENVDRCQSLQLFASETKGQLNHYQTISELLNLRTRDVGTKNNLNAISLREMQSALAKNANMIAYEKSNLSDLKKEIQMACNNVVNLSININILQALASIAIGLLGFLAGRNSREQVNG